MYLSVLQAARTLAGELRKKKEEGKKLTLSEQALLDALCNISHPFQHGPQPLRGRLAMPSSPFEAEVRIGTGAYPDYTVYSMGKPTKALVASHEAGGVTVELMTGETVEYPVHNHPLGLFHRFQGSESVLQVIKTLTKAH